MKKDIPYRVGLERESLRMSKDGKTISKNPHPRVLGDPLSNKTITLDFAESQIEIATPIFSSHKKAIAWIDMTLAFIAQNIGDEILWPMSVPPNFDENVAIANFGFSPEGRKKHLYRRGLRNRFSLEKQLLCGYHYNFSFQNSFFEEYKKEKGSLLPTNIFASECYLHMMRNFMRFSWIIPYFYGASVFPFATMDKNSFPHATSMRTSRFGYTNEVQQEIALNYNHLPSYIEELRILTNKACPAYAKYQNDQISDAVLQIPNELYSMIRPKRVPHSEISELDALGMNGIEYLEIRLLDVNPLFRTGTSLEALSFIKNILTFCLFTPSGELSKDEYLASVENYYLVAENGLDKNLSLSISGQRKNISDWINDVLSQAQLPLPDIMPQKIKKLANSNPSIFAINQAKHFSQEWNACGCSRYVREEIENEVIISNVKKHLRESPTTFPIEPIKNMGMSTQVMISEALKNNIDVKLLDTSDNIIRLKNNNVSEIIKSASCTSKDSFISVLITRNKKLTKHILKEHDISTPEGIAFTSIEDALIARPTLSMDHLVIKPNTTNKGISIHFVERNDEASYTSAILESLSHSKEALVEEFIDGLEYRFLVIDSKVIAITKRISANVIGNNTDTIEQLIANKNKTKFKEVRIPKITDSKILSRILKKGEIFSFWKNSNLSKGGDSVDATDDVDQSYRKLAIDATKAVESKICGVDMIIKDCKTPASTSNYSIIELNFNPMLFMHTHPDVGKPRDVATPIFKLLGLL